MKTLIKLESVSKHFGNFRALSNINLQVDEGEVLSVIGPSGSGKSTMIRCINLLEQYDSSGSIIVDNKLVKKGKALREVRANIGMVFQNFNLFPHMTILDNVTLAPMRTGGLSDADAKKRAHVLLEEVGILDQADKYPDQLSGGQQQRVAIARSIAKRPTLLLGDELTGNLDTETSNKVMEALVSACKQENITSVFVTHDEGLVKYATRVIRIDSGKIVSDEHTNNDSSE